MSGLPRHPLISRRTAVQAGAVGLLGLGMNHLDALRAVGAERTKDREAGARLLLRPH